jgi:hypothetical protein
MRRILVALFFGLLASPALAVETLAVNAAGDPPAGPGPELAEMTHQLRGACRERVSGVLDGEQMRTRLFGPEASSTLAELQRAYDGGYAAYSVMDFNTAIQTFQTVVDELEKSPESPEVYALWLKAILHLAYARESSGGDASELLGRVLATHIDYRLDANEYPPSMQKKVNALRTALKAGPMRKLNIASPEMPGTVFVNGRPLGVTPVSIALPPGKYRVGGIAGSTRVPSVRVEIQRENATVALDFALAGALRADAGPGVAVQKSEREAAIVRSGAWLGVDRVLATSVVKDGALFLVGSLYDVRRGALLREAKVRMTGGGTPAALIGALAGFILTGQPSPDVKPSEIKPPEEKPREVKPAPAPVAETPKPKQAATVALAPAAPAAKPVAAPAPTSSQPSEPRVRSSAPWYLVAAGAVAVAVGTGFALAAASAASDRDKAVTGTSYVASDASWQKSRTMSGVAFGIGGAAMAGGLVWRFAF